MALKLCVHPAQLREFAEMPEERWIQLNRRMTLIADFGVGPGPLVRGVEGEIHYDNGVADEDWISASTEVEQWLATASTEAWE